MYSYHNTIKKRIRNGELVGYEYVENYKNIGECLLLYFCSPPFERPIRPHKYHEYTDFLNDYEQRLSRKTPQQPFKTKIIRISKP